GIQRIDENDIHAPVETQMLEAVVENQHVDTELPFQQQARKITVGADANRSNGCVQEHLRFVAGVLGGDARSGGQGQVLFVGSTPIAASENAGSVSAGFQPFDKIENDRRLAC